jgi:hypothetical protein
MFQALLYSLDRNRIGIVTEKCQLLGGVDTVRAIDSSDFKRTAAATPLMMTSAALRKLNSTI